MRHDHGFDRYEEPVELSEDGHVLLWAMRAIVVGRSECVGLRRAWRDTFGAAAETAFAHLFTAVGLMRLTSARMLRIHMPGCGAISGDEMTYLAILSAAQSPAPTTGPWPEDAWIGRLTGGPVDSCLRLTLRCVADMLRANGKHLDLSFGGEAQDARSSFQTGDLATIH